jgi:hypothetical protein
MNIALQRLAFAMQRFVLYQTFSHVQEADYFVFER